MKLNSHKTYKEISEEFGLPISVIFNRIKGRNTPLLCTKSGRRPVLDPNVENLLVNCIIARAQMGYPCDNVIYLKLWFTNILLEMVSKIHLKTTNQVMIGSTVL